MLAEVRQRTHSLSCFEKRERKKFFGGNRIQVLTVTNWELVPLGCQILSEKEKQKQTKERERKNETGGMR